MQIIFFYHPDGKVCQIGVIGSLALGTPVIAFKEITSLKDFERNIMNQTIILTENTNSLLKLLKKLKPRKDYLKPRLRKKLAF